MICFPLKFSIFAILVVASGIINGVRFLSKNTDEVTPADRRDNQHNIVFGTVHKRVAGINENKE